MIKFAIKFGMLAIVGTFFLRAVSFFLLGFTGIFSAIFGFIFSGVISIVSILLGVVFLIKILSNSSSSRNVSKKHRKSYGSIDKYLNEGEKGEIELALSRFFKTNDKLIIKSEELYLRPRGDKFLGLGDLVLWYKGEAVATLENLSGEHADKSTEILDFIRGKKPVQVTPQPESSGLSTKTKAQSYIERLDKINDGIDDVPISEALSRTTRLLGGVHSIELKYPDSEKLRKLYDYYLPILMSMLTKFMNLGENAPLSRDYIETKSRLTETVGMINEALVSISSDYYGGEMIDITADAKTLQSILKKDGVVGNSFDIYDDLDKVVEEEKELLANDNI